MVTLRDLLLNEDALDAPSPIRRHKGRNGWRDEVHAWLLGPDEGAELENKADRSPGREDRQHEVRPERVLSRAIDLLKAGLCVLMVASHVNLCLVHPKLLLHHGIGHAIGNLAASLCLLGFLFSYGWTCWEACVSKDQPDLLWRVGRAAALAVCGAAVCSFAWCFVAFKMPLTVRTAWSIVTFNHVWGNGPDFLVSFTICLLVIVPLRKQLRETFGVDARPSRLRIATALFIMLGGPILTTFMVIPDCSGPSWHRYAQFLFICDKRDAVGMASFPAFPHLLYFNVGLLMAAFASKLWPEMQPRPDEDYESKDPVERALDAARYATAQAARRDAEYLYRRDFLRMHFLWALFCLVGLIVFALPLISVWEHSYGNVSAATPWGSVIRGNSRGPSALWLLGNFLPVFAAFLLAIFLAWLTEKLRGPALWLSGELSHYGSNVLLYLVVTDIVLAGLYNGDFPLTVADGGMVTVCLMGATRFVHYLGASSRQ